MPTRAKLILLLLVLVIVGGVVGGWWWLAYGRLPLRGDSSHDFGTVEILGDDVLLSHEFKLTNHGSEAIAIRTLRASCGCAGGDPDRDVVQPGETLTITARLALEHAGPRKASLAIMFEDGRTQRVFMKGIGRKNQAVIAMPPNLVLRPGEDGRFNLEAAFQREGEADPGEPGPPTITAPEGLVATFGGWTRMSEGDPELMTADKWRGRVDVTWDAASLDADTPQIQVVLDTGARVRVMVQVLPPRPVPATPTPATVPDPVGGGGDPVGVPASGGSGALRAP